MAKLILDYVTSSSPGTCRQSSQWLRSVLFSASPVLCLTVATVSWLLSVFMWIVGIGMGGRVDLWIMVWADVVSIIACVGGIGSGVALIVLRKRTFSSMVMTVIVIVGSLWLASIAYAWAIGGLRMLK